MTDRSDASNFSETCRQVTAHDLDLVWQWNHQLPPTHSFCMHDKISEQAQKLQDKVAICSWDGDLTYTLIDQHSTSIAYSLRDAGVQPHDVLPICFEKSRWTVIAVLGAMKAGATFVLMDPTLPLARLQNTAEQVGVKWMLTSRKQHNLSALIAPKAELLVVEADTLAPPSDTNCSRRLPVVTSSNLMYIIFTSGSTGTPKGVMVSHQTYSSSAIPRAEAVGYTEESRVLDFASYAFDVSIDSMLLTLLKGGCLCIPSDEDRLNDMNGVMRRMRVNYAGLTPSVARILDPDVIASLTMLGLGGEAVIAREANHWGKVTRIVIGYGPCECTIGCTINSSSANGRDYISIGRGNGAAIWIVDPDDHEMLMPVGAVGELLVEGPIVGEGYLHDPAKTKAAFVSDPVWLMAGHQKFAGRQGRLYKSGDLVRYDPDESGDIVFVGRKDTQVKIRGQRVELGEIEWQLHNLLPKDTVIIAEVIVPDKSQGQPMLMAFVASMSAKVGSDSDQQLHLVQPSKEFAQMLSKADTELARVLPRYMVPTVYVPVNHIPVLISGKTDRKRLRQFAATVDLQQLHHQQSSTDHQGLNDLEQIVQQAWSQVLKLKQDNILLNSNFVALGGDSIAAMRLVSICKEQDLDLTVVNIFHNPTLAAMARAIRLRRPQPRMEVPAFSMISQTVQDTRLQASRACASDPVMIEDVYPCTPGQESLLTFSLKSTKPYIAQRLACIPEHISLDDWKRAWEKAVAASPILRTRLIQSHDSGLQQVVLKENITWRFSTDLKRYLNEDRDEKMDLGQSLARYAIIDCVSEDKRFMVWTIHHAVYDGWSEPLMLKKVVAALQDQDVEVAAQMKDFVKHLRDIDEVSIQRFWQLELDGAVGPQFPKLPHRDYMPVANTRLERRSFVQITSGSPFTTATYVRGAIALVMSQYTGSDDIVLSETLTGRDISLVGVENIEGPLITTIPVRIRVSRTGTVETYLHAIQRSMMTRTPYEHFGIQNIRRTSQDAQYACEARVGLVIQPAPEYTGGDLGFQQEDFLHEALKFNPYPIMLACETFKDGIRVCASFDDSLISTTQMERLLEQVETAYAQLAKGLDNKLGEMSCVSSAELNQIWKRNQIPPLSFDQRAGRFHADKRIKSGSDYPPAWVSWVCDARNPSSLSPIGCVGELWIEGALGSCKTDKVPAWLLNGSSEHSGRHGNVQATGDLVRLDEDGSLIFIGRKDNILSVKGHEMNVADLEARLADYLPPTINAAAAVTEQPSNSTQQAFQQELVALIEQPPTDKGLVSLVSAEHVAKLEDSDTLNLSIVICARTSVELIELLRKLDLSIRDSLPPYMTPTVYIIVDRIPQGINHKVLSQLISRIPQHVLDQSRQSFKQAWAKSSLCSSLTPAEDILRAAWAEVLKITPEQINLDDNFFRLGADSVLAMKLISNLRGQGCMLTMADIFQHMRLRDAAAVLRMNQLPGKNSLSYEAFSMLGDLNTSSFISDIVRPQLADPTWAIQDVLPTTDSQAFDVAATIDLPRTSVQYTMLHFNKGIDRSRLHQACGELIKTHGIMRTVFVKHRTKTFQVVLKSLDNYVTTYQTGTDISRYVSDHCVQDIESELRLGSSFLKLAHIEGEYGESCLVIRLSHAQYDGTSLPMLLRDLETLYTDGKVVSPEPFSSYMAQIHDVTAQAKAVSYWRSLLAGSPVSALTTTSAPVKGESIFLEQIVDTSRRPQEITIANLIAAAWALVLARRLQMADVTFGSVTSGRQIDMASVEKVMGPCYQFTPIRVVFDSRWTAMDLLQFVQKQRAESALHDFLGFETISERCTSWPSKTQFFNTIVHHQDFEDFDTMSFAGEDCRVDILNPHGDAGHPLKVASFVREGQLHVGVVGFKRDSAFVQTVLQEVTVAIEELATGGTESALLRV